MPALSLDRAAAAPERSVAPLAHRQQPLSSATLLLPKTQPSATGPVPPHACALVTGHSSLQTSTANYSSRFYISKSEGYLSLSFLLLFLSFQMRSVPPD